MHLSGTATKVHIACVVWDETEGSRVFCQAMDTTDPEKIGPKPAEVDGVTMLHLLQSCSGAFQPGILTALVGSSGAGKTTLMDVLAGRKTSGFPCPSCLYLYFHCFGTTLHAVRLYMKECVWGWGLGIYCK